MMWWMGWRILPWMACSLLCKEIESFHTLAPTERHRQRLSLTLSGTTSREAADDVEDEASSSVEHPSHIISDPQASRRTFLSTSASAPLLLLPSNEAHAVETPVSVRPTVYRVDSTIPPTLKPVPSARTQNQLLADLGRGSGTSKDLTEALNLNNILNRAVFGTIQTAQDLVSPKANAAAASFVCLGVTAPNDDTMELATFIAESISRRAKRSSPESVAIGITVIPLDCQDVLDQYCTEKTFGIDQLFARLSEKDDPVSTDTLQAYKPLLTMAKSLSIRILAMGLPTVDTNTVLKGGLQSLDATKRSQYVMDPTGFIAQTNDPKFKLYTDRVLLRSVEESNAGNYFAERILAHEAAATIAVRSLADAPVPRLVTIVAPAQDVRYLGGINGRLPRIYNAMVNGAAPTITDNDVTTILLNPTALSTLSMTKRLRLEIGTGPDTLDYQTKVADYLWFSSSPPVSLLRRVMDY